MKDAGTLFSIVVQRTIVIFDEPTLDVPGFSIVLR
jgi:hypothetical protein